MPQLGETVTEGTVLTWLVKVGDVVSEDDPILEISTDKVDTEVPSPFSGTVTALLVNEGETVAVGANLLELDGGSVSSTEESKDEESKEIEAPHKEENFEVIEKEKDFLITVKDEGPGFSEASTQKIFKRFYSNRPEKFGEHSGLGLNIVKSIVEMHGGSVRALNRSDIKKGAQIELELPKRV